MDLLDQCALLRSNLLGALVDQRLQAMANRPKAAANGFGVLPGDGGVVAPLVARFVTNLPQHVGVGILGGLSQQRFELLTERFASAQVGVALLIELGEPGCQALMDTIGRCQKARGLLFIGRRIA